MCSYLQDTWKKIKEDSPSKETVAKATGTVVLALRKCLTHYHRKSIAQFVSDKTRLGIKYLKCTSDNCSKSNEVSDELDTKK